MRLLSKCSALVPPECVQQVTQDPDWRERPPIGVLTFGRWKGSRTYKPLVRAAPGPCVDARALQFDQPVLWPLGSMP